MYQRGGGGGGTPFFAIGYSVRTNATKDDEEVGTPTLGCTKEEPNQHNKHQQLAMTLHATTTTTTTTQSSLVRSNNKTTHKTRRRRRRPREARQKVRRALSSRAEKKEEESPSVASPPSSAREIEFVVEMRCGKCVEKVERSVLSVPGVLQVSSSLETNTVRVLATTPVKTVEEAIASTGYKNRLIGQGNVELFNERLAERLGMDLRTLRQSLAAVAEFKGEVYNHASCKGVVRFVQVDEETATFEADVLGLEKGRKYKLRVRMYGDTTRGVESCGEVYKNEDEDDVIGDLCTVQAMENGSIKASLQLPKTFFVWDIIGRALCIEEVVTDGDKEGLRVAAVLARSAGVGENMKMLCQCDGTVIWESSPDDFLKRK